MRYIVAILKNEVIPDGDSDEEGEFEGSDWYPSVQSLIPCDDVLGVSVALGIVQMSRKLLDGLKMDELIRYDWSVFELVEGKFERRSVIMTKDGRTVDKIV